MDVFVTTEADKPGDIKDKLRIFYFFKSDFVIGMWADV